MASTKNNTKVNDTKKQERLKAKDIQEIIEQQEELEKKIAEVMQDNEKSKLHLKNELNEYLNCKTNMWLEQLSLEEFVEPTFNHNTNNYSNNENIDDEEADEFITKRLKNALQKKGVVNFLDATNFFGDLSQLQRTRLKPLLSKYTMKIKKQIKICFEKDNLTQEEWNLLNDVALVAYKDWVVASIKGLHKSAESPRFPIVGWIAPFHY